MSELLAAALAYAAQGIPVFPCIPGTKKPLTAKGFYEATTEPSTLRQWWTDYPDANIAFSPHMVGQGVVDLDPPDGQDAWEDWTREQGGVPPTWTVRTPRGGLHVYYKGELPTSVRKLVPGKPIDTRGRGSYALLPPSRTPDGVYRLECAEPPAPVPFFLAERCLAMKTRLLADGNPDLTLDQPQNVTRGQEHIRLHGNVVEGFRNQKAFELAADLRDLGISEPLARELLTAWDENNQPPLGDELALPVWSAYHGNSQNKAPGAKAVEPAAGLLASIPAPIEATPARHLIPFAFRGPHEWSGLTRSPSIIEGILPAQGTGILYAPPGSFKSFLALGMAFAVASGRAAFDRYGANRTAPVAYCAGEGHLAVATQRLPALFNRHNVPMTDATPFYLLNGVPLARETVEGVARQFVASIRQHMGQPGLVVLDTVARSMAGLNENDASDAGQFLELIETVARELDCFVLGVAHEGKDESRGIRGSSAIEAGVDVIWQARRAGPDSLAVTLNCKKDKDGDTHGTVYLLGQKVNEGLVFSAVDQAEWMKGSGKRPGLVTPSDVGHALADLDAREGRTVPTRILAAELAGPSADDATIKAKALALSRGVADGTLLPFVVHQSENTRDPSLWSIPAISTD